jgi:single-strand DNA-binding protein
VNKIIVIGNLGRDPEMRYTPNGQSVTTFSVASSRRYTTADGERREETEWFNVNAWGRLADLCNQYLAKGRQVFVQGRIQSRSYEDKTGNTRYITEIIAQRVQFLGGAGGTRASQEPQDQGFGDPSPSFQSPSIDDDIPF